MSARRDTTKKKLFEATLTLASDRGLAGLTVDEIAAAAGVAKGTVYYNFGSKDTLVDELLRYGIDMLAQRLADSSDSADPIDTIESMVDSALEFICEYPGFSQILVSELCRTPGQWRETLSLLRGEIISILKEQLARIAATQRLPDGVDVSTAAASLFGTLLVIALDWLVFQPQRTRSEVRDSIMLLVRSLAHGGPGH